jgi:hypothetical protein
MEMAASTWTGEWWKLGGGGTAWDSFAYDPELDLFYIGTGNGSPWSRTLRSPGGGDNLFLASIVAVRPDTGEYGSRSMQFILDQNRLNVAISRAQSLAIVVGDPRLAESPCSSIEDMRRLNLYCWLQSFH